MSRLGGLRRQGLVVELPCRVRVEGEVELVLPPELEAGVGQRVVPFLGTRVPLGDVGCVGGDLVGDDAGLDVVTVRQAQVLLGRDVAQHGRAPPGDHRGTDAGGDVVVRRRDVRGQRAERIERSFIADLLLKVDVLLDLVHRDMARAFDHGLYVETLGDPVEFPQSSQFSELCLVVGVRDGAGPQAVAERVCDVVRGEDLAEFLEVLVQERLLVVREAPGGHDRAAAGDDARLAVGRQRHIGQAHARVDRHVVHTLLGLFDDRVLVDLPGQILGPAVDLLQGLVERHGADGDGGVAQHPLTRGVDVAAGGQVHDRVGAPAGRPGHLFDLLLDGGRHRRVADVGVDLHQEPLADDHRLDLRVVDVGRQHGPARGDLVADHLGRDVLPDGHVLHLGRDLAAAGVRELRDRLAAPAATRLARATGEDGVEIAEAAAGRGVLDAVVLGTDGTARVLLGVTAGDDPVLAQRGQAPADVGVDEWIGVRARRVVQRDRLPVGEMHLTDRHAQVGARALDVRLMPADGLPGLLGLCVLNGGRRACVLVGHVTYSLRRHYPVTGSAVDAAASVCRRSV